MSKDIKCPNCGKWSEVCHDDGAGYEEGCVHEQECDYCDGTIEFVTHINFSYWPVLESGLGDWE